MVLADMGTVSSRGQIAIPSEIRAALGLTDGTKVLFLVEGKNVLLRKVEEETFASLTEPLRKAKKNIEEQETATLVKRWRQR